MTHRISTDTSRRDPIGAQSTDEARRLPTLGESRGAESLSERCGNDAFEAQLDDLFARLPPANRGLASSSATSAARDPEQTRNTHARRFVGPEIFTVWLGRLQGGEPGARGRCRASILRRGPRGRGRAERGRASARCTARCFERPSGRGRSGASSSVRHPRRAGDARRSNGRRVGCQVGPGTGQCAADWTRRRGTTSRSNRR